jgi:hypothetical protein
MEFFIQTGSNSMTMLTNDSFCCSLQQKAANTATNQVNKIASTIPSTLPSWNQLKGDWKFWIGVLAILSIGTSLLSASTIMPPNLPNNASPDSFYI